jgi:hypothetical protein
MIGVMVLTCFDVLYEHSLFKPDSEIKNLAIISLLLLEFIEGDAIDLDCKGWGVEIVRLCDEAGIDLMKELRKQVRVKEKTIDDYRAIHTEKKHSEFGDEKTDGNGYIVFSKKKGWKREDDILYDRMWYRWDWALEVRICCITIQLSANTLQYKEFKVNHPGGTRYDLTKMSMREMKEYSLGLD